MRSNSFYVKVPKNVSAQVEAQANNCENKASALKYFKNSFAWLTGMKNLIFDFINFF